MNSKHIFNDIFLFVSAQIPGFMVMQVRYLYEAEGNKKAKDAKAVSSKCAWDTRHQTVRFGEYLFGRPKLPGVFGFTCSDWLKISLAKH